MPDPSTPGHPLRLVIVGGIGAGKSTVMTRLAELGAVTIEADQLGHTVLEPDGAAFDAVVARWPEAVVDGAVNRQALAQIVFRDPDELAALEAITHPAIAGEIARLAAEAGEAPVAVEVPVEANLVGDGWTTVAVVADRDRRIRRAAERGFSPDDARRRADAQPTDAAWAASADVVLANDGTVEELVDAVDALWERRFREMPPSSVEGDG